jgi:uncharacterized protein
MPNPSKTNKPDGHEIRALAAPVEIRAAADGTPPMAFGYAAPFNVWTDIGGYFRERIAPGAFEKTLKQRDVVALHSHDVGRVVGRTSSGTLRLREDANGLAYENDLPDTTDGRDLAVQIERKDITGNSFGFIATRQEWDDTKDPPERTILEAELWEITYTAFPQYPDTEVGIRSLEGARQERREHNKTGASARISARRARMAHLERRI